MEYNTASPIYLQVINELKKRMVKGELKPGEKMPSNRKLAVLFKVNQNTAARIYREMEDLGFQKGDIIDRIADYKEEEK